MSQSGTIVAFLLAAFVLYLAAEGRLPAYGAALWGNTKAPPPSSSSSSGGIMGTVKGILGAAKTAGEVAAVVGA